MAIVDQKLAALHRIERLHRIRRRLEGDVELEAVIAELETEMGETVSQRIAARFLDVSHTTLGRWVRSDIVPLVENREGRSEVPVPALLRLAESSAASDAPASDSPVLGRPSNVEGQRTAEAHSAAADRSLAYHSAVADRLTRADAVDALYRVRKWRTQGKLDHSYAHAWEQILDGSLSQIRGVLTDTSTTAADLRQNSPFAGLLSEPERRTVIGAPAP